MKLNSLVCTIAIFCNLLFCVAQAANEIPNAAREKAAKSVGAVYSTDITADAVKYSGLPGIYQVRMPQGPVFVSEDGAWVFQGNLFNVAKRENETEKALAEMQKVKFSDMPLDAAVKIVRGNGSRKLITFEDVNCGYCKKLAAELERVDNVTIYVFPVAILSATSKEMALSVLCSEKPALAWNSLMVKAKPIPACSTKIKAQAAEKRLLRIHDQAQKSFITGTPTLIFQDDSRVNGYIPLGDLVKRMDVATAVNK